MPIKLTTHVLDVARGIPAAGMAIELWSVTADRRELLAKAVTNSNGRTDGPLLAPDLVLPGEYELVFCVGDYFGTEKGAFLDRVPVRFGLSEGTYHVPLLCSPWSYTTYRGS